MKNQAPFNRHARIALINLLLIAAIGIILRYKIAFSLPLIDQKHLLHAHSHFAFSGWVSQLLMVLLVRYLDSRRADETWFRYRTLINANLICAYGMLISFTLQGYGAVSIGCSTASILVAYAFAIRFWKDLNSLPVQPPGHLWMKASLICSAVSSLGAFALAFMMATKSIHQEWYLASVYFFLHFQYNGWFFFACMGLASVSILRNLPVHLQRRVFALFAAACIPAYLLSALWLPVPLWVYVLVVAAAVAQVLAWSLLLAAIRQQLPDILDRTGSHLRWLLVLPAIALTIKLLLQLGSTIPSLSNLAFGYRPIVIGYLHLILLGVISLFLIAFLTQQGIVRNTPSMRKGTGLTAAGIILNELLLMTQGVAAMQTVPIPYINEALLVAAATIFAGLSWLLLSQRAPHTGPAYPIVSSLKK